jgi:uncharacterized protein YigE (DUF2233 family)
MKLYFTRRQFLCSAILSTPVLLISQPAATAQSEGHLNYNKLEWNSISKGLNFARVQVLRDKEPVEVLAVLKIDPAFHRIRVFNSFDQQKTVVKTIEEWQAETSANAMINGAQYMADPYYMPVALVICDGKQKGPRNNKSVRGMFVSEPSDAKLPKADLLDFEYDSFDAATTSYTQGIQHWPILLDRSGKIKVKNTELRSYRTVVARDFQGQILFFTTEGNFFTLYGFAEFLKNSNGRSDKGFYIHTAMNMDGGDEANMIVKAEKFSYLTYNERLKRNSEGNGALFNFKTRLPGVIGVFPR